MGVDPASPDQPRRIQITLRKHSIGWYPKPTIVFDGRGYPTQWGTGTWQLPDGRPTTIKIYLFNRVWSFGTAEFTIDSRPPESLEYTAPRLPFGAGRFVAGPSDA